MKAQKVFVGSLFLTIGAVGWVCMSILIVLISLLGLWEIVPFDWYLYALVNTGVMLSVGMCLVLNSRIEKLEQQAKQQIQPDTTK